MNCDDSSKQLTPPSGSSTPSSSGHLYPGEYGGPVSAVSTSRWPWEVVLRWKASRSIFLVHYFDTEAHARAFVRESRKYDDAHTYRVTNLRPSYSAAAPRKSRKQD